MSKPSGEKVTWFTCFWWPSMRWIGFVGVGEEGSQRYIVKSSEADTRRSITLPWIVAALRKRSLATRCLSSGVVGVGIV